MLNQFRPAQFATLIGDPGPDPGARCADGWPRGAWIGGRCRRRSTNRERAEIVPRERRPPFFRSCLDWTARRPFLRGTLGVALICGYFEPGWTERIEGSRVAITEKRRHELHQAFGFRLEQQ